MRRDDPADDPDYCRVIVRIREKTRRGVMDLLSASGMGGNLSPLVDDLLARWLADHEPKRSARRRKKARLAAQNRARK